MHFLQNSWLVNHWHWLLMMMLIGIAVVAYVNNRRILLKKSLVALSSVFILTITLSLPSFNLVSPTHSSPLMEKLSADAPRMESPNLLSKVFSFALDIMKDKIRD